jgi:Domain of unknown function (DUF4037)
VPVFIPGLDLAASFYAEVVEARLAGVMHSAVLLGPGSDVLGYDDARSTDHYWGPRLQVFVDPADVGDAQRVLEALPAEHRGWPTRIGSDQIPFRVHVDVWVLANWLMSRLGCDPRRGLSTEDWLVLPQQLLLETTSGRVFHDGLGELEPLRASLDWYPDDVWLWLLAAQWTRIGQEEAFVGRAAAAGDDLGSRIVAARIVRDLVRLCFLLERSYAPYSKWLGTAFSRLAVAAELGPHLTAALSADTYPDREAALVGAYEQVAHRQNLLALTRPVEPTARQFHDRPYRVIAADRFATACIQAITEPQLRSLPLVGSVDQWVDSTDVLSHGDRVHRLIGWYRLFD